MVDIVRTLRPDCMVVEELWTAYKNPSTAVLMGHARGVLCLAGGENGVAVHTLAHSLVKRALVGSGSARKEQVKKMVVQLLGFAATPEAGRRIRRACACRCLCITQRSARSLMFSKITGTVVERQGDRVVIETGGLGYDIVLPPCVADKVPSSNGAPVTLEIYSNLQMDGNAGRFTYFGFTNAIEREFFEALLSVASIGPKSAARAFALPMARIARAIDEGDHALSVRLPGIGQQKARDIVAKLQGKVDAVLVDSSRRRRRTAAETRDAGVRGRSAGRSLTARIQAQRSRSPDTRIDATSAGDCRCRTFARGNLSSARER